MPWLDGKWHNSKQNGKGGGKSGNKAAAGAQLIESLATLINNPSNGKGKGKGKGKDATPGVPLKPGQQLKGGQWLCKCHVCSWAQRRVPNHPDAKRCGNMKCCLLTSEAMNPPLDERVPPSAPSYSVKTAQANATAAAAKKKSAEAAKEKKEAAAKEATQVTTSASSGQITEETAAHYETAAAELRSPPKPANKILQFQEVQKEEFSALLPSLGTLLTSQAAESLPPP